MVTLLTIVHITVCLFLILVVLLQAGKGGGMGIAFGGSGSQTVFGSSGAGNFLTRLTSITAALFLLTSLALAHYSSRQDSKRLQDLASQKANEKKVEDEKAVKLKADLEKTRPATTSKDAGAASTTEGLGGAAAAALPRPPTTNPTPPGASIPAAGAPPMVPVKVDPKLLKPTGTAKPPAVPMKAQGAAATNPIPNRRPPVRAKPVPPAAGAEAPAPAPAAEPAAPAAPTE
jgi:preprotein translocase subunit SecG